MSVDGVIHDESSRTFQIGLVSKRRNKPCNQQMPGKTKDDTTAQGRLIFNMLASLAKFEKDLIRERTLILRLI